MSGAASIVIAAGGTGGHVFPGLAIADALAATGQLRSIFVGTKRGFEAKLVPEAGYELVTFDLQPIHGGGTKQAISGSLAAARALSRASRFLRECSPVAVVSIGGYAAGPVALAAAAMRIPVAVVEPNSVMGLSNRLLSPVARRIYLAFERARPVLSRDKVRLAGVPLRGAFVPRRRVGQPLPRRVLVLGGSQGAQALNDRLPDALGRVAASRVGGEGLEVVHQAGAGKDALVREAYVRAGLPAARVVGFQPDMVEMLAWADLVVARAGAGTIAEIAAIGRPSLLIPLPTAADDHQAANAASYASKGAAVWLRQESADSTRVAVEISRLLDDDEARAAMAASAESEGRPEAARSIARDLLQLIEAN